MHALDVQAGAPRSKKRAAHYCRNLHTCSGFGKVVRADSTRSTYGLFVYGSGHRQMSSRLDEQDEQHCERAAKR